MEANSMKKFSFFLLFLFCSLIFAGCSGTNTIKTTSSAQDYVGVNFETVVSELQSAGFQNIEVKEIEDLTSNSELQDGDVGQISINGDTLFEQDSEFEKDVPVIITYHTIKKIELPLSLQNLQSYDYLEIADMFSTSGFTNITTEEVFDLEPGDNPKIFENEVLINGKSVFNKSESLAFDTPITIICHKPYETFEVNILIDFIPNIIFSRYDVRFLIDGDEQGFMQHGKDGNYAATLKNGSHVLSFVSSDSDSVNGEFTLDVDCNIDASFKINCSSDKINVEPIYIDYHEILAADEAKTMSDKYGLIGKNYETVVETLKSWGFTNIKTQPQYDIVWGFTEAGSVANVTINGRDDYQRGTVFQKTDEIIVSYHLPSEDDPNSSQQNTQNASEDTSLGNENLDAPSETSEDILTVSNCENLANLILLDRIENADEITGFVTTYQSKTVELELITAFVEPYKDYNTRFNYLLYAVNGENVMLDGPAFMFKNVNYHDLKLTGSNVPDTFGINIHCLVRAEIVGYENDFILLDPEEITVIDVY